MTNIKNHNKDYIAYVCLDIVKKKNENLNCQFFKSIYNTRITELFTFICKFLTFCFMITYTLKIYYMPVDIK